MTKTNHELRKLIHANQKKFLDHMNVAEADLPNLLSADHLNEILKVNRENSFLREKLNRCLGKQEIPSPSTGLKNQHGTSSVPSKTSPLLNESKSDFSNRINKNPVKNVHRTNKIVPTISRDIALKLVLHEVKRLSKSFIDLKDQNISLRNQVVFFYF